MTTSDTDSDTDEYYSVSSDDGSSDSVPSLADTLSNHFSDVSRNFNVVHINAQSIPAHFSDMLTSFDCTNVHAILVSESWLKPCLSTVSYSLPGFQLVRNDRTCGRGGGVAMFIRSYIPFSVVDMSPQPPPISAGEHLFIEVSLHNTKLLLGVFYSPSLRVDYFSSLEVLLENLTPSYSHTIVMGDFNTCLLKNDSRSANLRSVIESCNLSILPLNPTHNLPNRNSSLLDLILVSSVEHVAKHGQCSADSFSYHDLLFLSYRIRTPKPKAKIVSNRNFRNLNVENLRRDAENIDWSPLFNSQCVDDKVNFFTSNLICLYDRHAPIQQLKVKHLPAPWLTEEIKEIQKKKARAHTMYKKHPTATNWAKFVSLRNHCNKMCRNAQRRHIHKSVEDGDPAKVWKFLKSLGIGKSRSNNASKDVDIDSLNAHFSASSSYGGAAKTATLNYLSSLPTPNCSPFVFSQFAACDVRKSIVSITSNAVGSDGVSRNMVLPILDVILPIICHILNYSISINAFPSTWKMAKIIPLPKKGNPTTISDYRPISILPFFSKVLERLIYTQLSSFLTRNCFLNPFQSGFRPGHSTTTALVHITDDVRSGMDKGKLTVLALLDFSNAFNTVDFDVLLGVLCSQNISPSAIDWFRSYLYGRQQCTCIENVYSSWRTTSAGVPQGGVLSPLLFAVFINSITNQLLSSYHLYADDLQIYSQATPDNLTQAVNDINQDLMQICNWSRKYGLNINPTKTQVLIVGSSRQYCKINFQQIPVVCCSGTIVPYSEKVKNLGIYMDKHLSWSPQIGEVSRKLFAAAGSLRRLRNFLPTKTKIALAQSLLLPILDYGDVSYLDITEDQLNKLERLQNLCIRFIFGLRKYDHISEFRSKLKWLPIRFRRNLHILSLLYSVLFHPHTPPYLKERFQFLKNTHCKDLRSSENLKLKMPAHFTHFAGKSFSMQAVRLWNSLPETIRQAKTLTLFKKLVKDHYLSL